MTLKMTRMDVWTAEIDDKTGGLARTLRAIADYGADLDCVVARRQHDKPGKGVVYVAPTSDKARLENANGAGLRRVPQLATLRVEGPNSAGIGAKLTKLIADAGINLHGVTATAIGRRFVCYLGFDTPADLDRAVTALQPMTKRTWPLWPQKTGARKQVPA